jgi:hypothetical protein
MGTGLQLVRAPGGLHGTTLKAGPALQLADGCAILDARSSAGRGSGFGATRSVSRYFSWCVPLTTLSSPHE